MRALAVAVGLAGLLPLLSVAGCPSQDDPPAGAGGSGASTGGSAGASGSSGAAGNTWDPVWHETKPKDWTSYPPDNLPDCGDGCRIAMNLPLRNPAVYGHSYSEKWLSSDTPKGVGFAAMTAGATRAIPSEPGTAQRSSVYGDYISYIRSFGIGDGQVEVASLVTGETKIAFRYTPAEAGDNNAWRTVMGPRHVFWLFPGGLWARNLETGDVKNLGGACWSYCPTATRVLCDDGVILTIDPDTGASKFLDYGGEWQTHGTCSPGRTQYAWVDYRDPPGPGSTDFNRSGGEVYVHDLKTGKTKRVTFDSPSSPRGKVYPAIDGDWVVWNEPGDSEDANPQTNAALLGAGALVKFDMKTGQRCRLTSRPMRLWFKSLHGTHVYGTWFDLPSSEVWLADLDLEHPSLTWDCVATPEWTP
jgi:hypothetical protein